MEDGDRRGHRRTSRIHHHDIIISWLNTPVPQWEYCKEDLFLLNSLISNYGIALIKLDCYYKGIKGDFRYPFWKRTSDNNIASNTLKRANSHLDELRARTLLPINDQKNVSDGIMMYQTRGFFLCCSRRQADNLRRSQTKCYFNNSVIAATKSQRNIYTFLLKFSSQIDESMAVIELSREMR